MTDVAIVGAGFAGLALASVCADAGLRVTVHERRPALAPEGVGLLLQPNGIDVLDRLGVLGAVLRAGERVDVAYLRDPSGRVRGTSSYPGLRHPHPYLIVVERTSVIDILAARLPETVELRLGSAVSAGDLPAAQLVVGADGVASAVRESIGARSRLRAGPDRYLIGIAGVPPPSDAIELYTGDGWCDGVLPLRGRTYFFDHVNADNRDAIERDDVGAWRETFARRVPGGDRIGAAIASFDEVGFLSGRTHVAIPRSRPGCVLIGDAAAAVHPHNGQGANRALEDAWQLGRLLAAHGPGAHAEIARWARSRTRQAFRQVAWSIWIGRTFDAPTPWWRLVRGVSYRMARIPAVNGMTTRRQAGL